MEGLHVMYYVIKTLVVLKISPLMVSNFCCEILCSLRRVAVAPLSQLIFQNRSGTPWRGLVCMYVCTYFVVYTCLRISYLDT